MSVYSRFPRLFLLVLIAILVIAPFAARFLSGTTEVVVSTAGGQVHAEVHGTSLDLPDGALDQTELLRLKLPTLAQLSVDPASSSLYWQPDTPGSGVLDPVETVGDWMQGVRPPSEWTSASLSDVTTATYRLKGGRALALLPLDTGDGSGVVLLVRPERAAFSWWTLENGQPGHQLNSVSYRPSGAVSLSDLAAEVALIAWAAALLGVLAWLASLLLSRLNARPASASAQTEVSQSRSPRFLDWLSRPSNPPIAFFLAGTILASFVGLVVLDGIPHVQDDVAYLFQGKIFAEWRSWVPAPPAPEFFQSGFIQIFEGRWFAKYPPGYPLLLVPSLWAGMPWLTNALSAGVALALIYMSGLRMFGAHVAAWAALLGLISPWVLFMSASYMSHPTTMMWVALFLFALVSLRLSFNTDKRVSLLSVHSRWGLLAGFAIGMAFVTREWTALGIGAGAALWALGDITSARRDMFRRLVPYSLVVVGFIPPLLFLLFQNHELTGNWLRLAQDLVGSYDQPGFGPGHGSEIGHTPAMGLYNGLVYLRTLATVFDGWPAPFALAPLFLGVLAPFAARSRKQFAWDLLLWLPLAGLLLAYFAWWSSTTIYGPRYWYEGMPFMLLMAGRGFDLLGVIAARALPAARAAGVRWAVPGVLFGILSVYTLTQSLPDQANTYTDYNDISVQPLEYVQDAHLTDALVFVALDPSRRNRDYGKAFFANDPMLRSPVVYARDMGAEANRYLAGLFPTRKPYWLPLDGPPQPGVGP
ncbi:MAG: hypothetical protein ABI670_07730 [Chloroflexota bacterium]